MQRRSFMAAVAAAAVPFLTRRNAKRKTTSRRQRGSLAQVVYISDWQPKSWRDVPPRFIVTEVYDPESLAECRKQAKVFNRDSLAIGSRHWLVVIATDGRLAKGGAI